MTDTAQDIIKKNTVDIHGKGYLTVAGRVQLLHEDDSIKGATIETEVLQFDPVIVIRARVITEKGSFTGISAVDPKTTKQIEKQSPYEVAETSAVGRALGFAGYGLIESIASADEMVKATQPVNHHSYGDEEAEWKERVNVDELPTHFSETAGKILTENKTNPYETADDPLHVCNVHHKQMKERVNKKTGGKFYDHRTQNPAGEWLMCNGSGEWQISNF